MAAISSIAAIFFVVRRCYCPDGGETLPVFGYVYLIAFGGNMGDREQFARGALDRLSLYGRVGRQSRWQRTAPLKSERYDTLEHEEYLNFVFEFATDLRPDELYRKICVIEDYFGHERTRRWLPRAVDLDLLFWSEVTGDDSEFQKKHTLTFSDPNGNLRIPHPEVWKRIFLLEMIENELKIELSWLSSSNQFLH